jgi:hypothetical protein
MKEKPTKLKAMHREILTTIKPEIRELAPRMSFIQTPSLTANYLVLAMNSRSYDILHRPALQDLPRLKGHSPQIYKFATFKTSKARVQNIQQYQP